MEADCYESKVFVPVIYEKEIYYPPSNIDEYYERLWTNIQKKFKHPEIEDMMQEISLHCLIAGLQFETYQNAEFYFYRALFNKSSNIEKQNKNRERLRLENLPSIEERYEDMDICDSCLNLKEIVFVYRDRKQFCADCFQIVISKILMTRRAA
jgi:hypothetical protein